MFNELDKILSRPSPFSIYTADELWTDPYISRQMLKYHLHPEIDAASRNKDFIKRSTSWICDHFQLKEGCKVADFGCGPGFYTSAFATTGAEVTGIDFSANSLAYARDQAHQNGLKIKYVNENYLSFQSSEKFDLITMIMCDFCALSPSQRKTMLRKFNSLLSPGGAVLLDVFSLNYFDSIRENTNFEPNLMNGFWAENTYYGFLCSFKYQSLRVTLDKYTIVEPHRTREVFNWLQCFEPAQLIQEFHENGFSNTRILGDVAGSLYQTESNEFAAISYK